MNPYQKLPLCSEETSAFLPRTTSSPNFAEILRKHRRSRSRKSCSRAPVHNTRRSESNGSENSQVLYMADLPEKKSRKTNRSLSSIGNGNTSSRQVDASKFNMAQDQEMGEETSWDVIDKEIFEWQLVCQTGRPYWWSPESKYGRMKRVSPRLGYVSHPRIWMRDVDLSLKSEYATQRRAVSDNYLADPSSVDDLAHLVAVQLLGSCFTLPPEHTMTYTSRRSSTSSPQDVPMISSLRMHTYFRYSPSFGHQAQNTSPVHLWPSTFDGPPPIPSTLAVTGNQDTGTKKKRRLLGTTEETAASENESDVVLRQYCMSILDPVKFQSSVGKKPIKCSSLLPRPCSESVLIEDDAEAFGSSMDSRESSRSNYRLQAVIRSEPHHVFVQPVKELVVKRWRDFRRRLSGSLHSPLPARTSADRISASEFYESGESSPIMSSDGKARRRRARERGEIESSSVESTPCYNSPISGSSTPAGNKRLPPLSRPPLTTPSWSAVIATAESIRNQNSSPASTSLVTCGSFYSRNELTSQGTSTSLIPLPPLTSGGRNTQRRRSMLSEVSTPDDFQRPRTDRNMLSAAGSALATPIEDPGIDMGPRRPLIVDVLNHPVSDSALAVKELYQPKPSLMRTSTTGTQVFTPNEDGVELDGLPVGPSRDHWAGKGNRRERTYLF